jgi:hypothetical protein
MVREAVVQVVTQEVVLAQAALLQRIYFIVD